MVIIMCIARQSKKITWSLLLLAALAGGTAMAQTASTNAPSAVKPTFLHDMLPLFMGKCSRCHNDQSSLLPNWEDYQTAFNDRKEIRWRVWDAW
ncbi:MAG TPA: hypothetical protein VF988_03845, partial [Verrucomicrobiae bacterium]